MKYIKFVLLSFFVSTSFLASAQIVVTDGTSWQCNTNPMGIGTWNLSGFTPVLWTTPTVPPILMPGIGNPALPGSYIPGITTGMWMDTTDQTTYYVNTVDLSCNPRKAMLYGTADDEFEFWINGNLVSSGLLLNTFQLDTTDVTSFLNAGTNYLAIKAVNAPWANPLPPGDAAAVFYRLVIDTVPNKLEAQFPSDTSLCFGDSLSFNLSGFDTYTWFDGNTDSNRTFSDTLNIWVEADTNGCVFSDTMNLNVFYHDSLQLPADTAFCAGNGLTITLPAYSSHSWSNGDTSSSVIIDSSQTLSVQTTDVNGCISTDTISVQVDSIPRLNFADSLFFCEQNLPFVLIRPGYNSYQWNTGDTTASLTISLEGTYTLSVVNANGCATSDTLFVQVDSLPKLNFPSDTLALCPGDSLLLNAFNANNQAYNWNNGSTDSALFGFTNTFYAVTVSNSCGLRSDSVYLSSNSVAPTQLINDTAICSSDSILLQVDSARFDSILWNNGSTNASLWGYPNQQYSVQAFSPCAISSDFVFISALALPQISLPADTLLCDEDSLLLEASFLPADTLPLWLNAVADSQFVVRQNGTYFASIANQCGIDSDTLSITFEETPSIQILDTALCSGQQTVLDAFFPGVAYAWSTGDTTSSITTTATGNPQVFTVTIANNCGSATDAVTVNTIPQPTVSLPPRQVICNGQGVFLNVTAPFVTGYQWSTGSSDAFITATTAGSYSVTVTNACGSAQASVNVVERNTPVADLGPDTTICEGYTYLKDFTFLGSTYLWNGEISTGIEEIQDSGVYRVRIENECGIATDQFRVNWITLPDANLGPDTTICKSEPHILSATYAPQSTFLWSTGSGDTALLIDEPGIYTLLVSNSCGTDNDAIRIRVKPMPNVYLGNDTLVCGNNDLALQIQEVDTWSYLWSTGEEANEIVVSDSGFYSVEVQDECGQLVSDTIFVGFNRTKQAFMPTAFSPNNDLLNDTIKPAFPYPVEYRFRVYNRWGNLVFDNGGKNIPWDGKTNGQFLDSGMYPYIIEYPNCFGRQEKQMGQITLLR